MQQWGLLLLILTMQVSALTLNDDKSQSLHDCKALLTQIETSDCRNKTLSFMKDAYLKVGINSSQRKMSFVDDKTQETAFELVGDFSPAPIFTLNLGDHYFENSNLGYELGFTYFSDTAYKQSITRSNTRHMADLQTYSKFTVLTFSPTLFYSFGKNHQPQTGLFTSGIGLNTGYMRIKGNAYLTESKNNPTCYQTATAFTKERATEKDIQETCPLTTFDTQGFTYGTKIYMTYEYQKWLAEISGSLFYQKSKTDYTFSTFDFSLSISRKFGF